MVRDSAAYLTRIPDARTASWPQDADGALSEVVVEAELPHEAVAVLSDVAAGAQRLDGSRQSTLETPGSPVGASF